jgi:hypothetical protein
MGWANCGEDDQGRPIGYAVAATCDHPDCSRGIDRGLSYVCGGMHGGGERGCGGYFCPSHLYYGIDEDRRRMTVQLCESCLSAWETAHP